MAEPIRKLDRENVELLYSEVQRKMEQVAAEYGLKLKMRRWTFANSGAYVNGGFRFAVIEAGQAMGPERADFARNAPKLGLESTDLDKEFEWHDGSRWRIVGINMRAKKYPVLAVEAKDNGKRCRFPAPAVRECLGRKSLGSRQLFGGIHSNV